MDKYSAARNTISWTVADRARLLELESLESDVGPLTADEYAEMRELLNREDAAFILGAAL